MHVGRRWIGQKGIGCVGGGKGDGGMVVAEEVQ